MPRRSSEPQGESRFLCGCGSCALGLSLLILFRSSRAFGRYLILGRSNREIERSLLRSFFLPLHRADGVIRLGGLRFFLFLPFLYSSDRRRRKVVDRYTKGALTAIALSLSIIAVQNAVGTSAAQQTPMKVQICDELLHCVQLTPVAHDGYALPTLSTPAARLLQSK